MGNRRRGCGTPKTFRLGEEGEMLAKLADFNKVTQAEQLRVMIRAEHARLGRTPEERWYAALRELALAVPPEKT